MISYFKKSIKNRAFLLALLRKVKSFLNLTTSYQDKSYFSKKILSSPNVSCLDSSDLVVVGDFKNQKYLLRASPENIIETSVYRFGVWETHIAELIHCILTSSPGNGVVLDIGSNVGATVIPQAKCFPNLNFFAIEAHPEIFARLQENLSLNSAQNVTAINKAVTNKENRQFINFYAQKSNNTNLGLSSLRLNGDIGDHEQILVPCISVDNLFLGEKSTVLVIKIDVQGAELDVIMSSRQTLERDRPVVIFELEEEYFSESEMEQVKIGLVEFFRDLDYKLYSIFDEKVMYRLHLEGYFHGDIVAFPNKI